MELSRFLVEVTFDTTDNSLILMLETPDGLRNINGGEIEIPQGISMINFQLVATNGAPPGLSAAFPANPVGWFNTVADTQLPISAPDNFLINWFTPAHFTIVVFNSALTTHSHPFNVIVAYDGNTYGADPTIVNMPPDSGGSGWNRVQEVIEESEVSISVRKAGSPRKGSNQGRKNHRRS